MKPGRVPIRLVSAPALPTPSAVAAFLLQDRAFGEKICPQKPFEIGVAPTDPFEQHGGMLHFFAHIMKEQLFQRLVLGIVGALAIPVDRIELFH